MKAIVRRYRECEHTDTLSGMPGAFRDTLERAALRRFVAPYVPPTRFGPNGEPAGTVVQDEDRISESPLNVAGAGSIVVYARDYRELSRWAPTDGAYLVGRYMFEADALPRPWVSHCESRRTCSPPRPSLPPQRNTTPPAGNKLDEVWVPSHWQKDTFVASGVAEAKLVVMPEAVDVRFFDPQTTAPIPLPGTSLDGTARDDPSRPFTFLSVFKMEDRKGWRELVTAYLR